VTACLAAAGAVTGPGDVHLDEQAVWVSAHRGIVVTVVGRLARLPPALAAAGLEGCDAVPAARREDFRTGRRAAALCLAVLGRADPVRRLPDGRPGFPVGVSGSISHCDGLGVCAARLGRRAVGVDLERVGRVPGQALRHMCGPAESAWVTDGRPDWPADHRLTAIFSAKEAVYKARHCAGRPARRLLEIELLPHADGFVTAPGPPPVLEVSVRWLSGYVVSLAAQIPAASAVRP
jgi:4'-phosphopantetheinyl transferase EntD